MTNAQTEIYIGFSRPCKWKIGAAAISWWIRRPYSHVYIRFTSSISEMPSSVYHAAHGMVHFRANERFLDQNIVIKEYRIPVSEECRRSALIQCVLLSGEGYGYKDLIKIFIADIAYSLFGKVLQFNDSYGYICSELVGKILIKMNITFSKPIHLLKPNDIDDKLRLFGYELSAQNL